MNVRRRALHIFALATLFLGLSVPSFAQISIGVAVNIAPPVLPVYEQPVCPGANYIWTPGYWAWNGYDYYWVPGTWVMAPAYGLLWTPGYWGWGTGGYLWHAGYWGPHIGFYGGVNYGFGYYGSGYEGGYWRGNSFFYNTAISRVNTAVIRNVYVNRTVIRNVNVNRVSFNGGRGGINARPSAQEDTAMRERRMGPVGAQETHERVAQQDRGNFYKSNRGVPATAALARPAANANDFHQNAVAGRPAGGAENRPAENRPGTVNRPANNAARPEARPTQQTRPANNTARPAQEQRPANTARPAPQQTRPTQNTSRPSPSHPANTARPAAPESRPAQESHPEGGGERPRR